MAALTVTGCSGGEKKEACAVPKATEVAALAAKAATVAKVVFQKVSPVTDGTTETDGWLVEGSSVVKGAKLQGPPTVVWPTISVGTPKDGERLVVFLAPHQEGQTKAGGATAYGYDIVQEGGILADGPKGLSRLCRDGRSEPAPPEILN